MEVTGSSVDGSSVVGWQHYRLAPLQPRWSSSVVLPVFQTPSHLCKLFSRPRVGKRCPVNLENPRV